MSEELKKTDFFELIRKSAQTRQEAEIRAKEEAGRERIDRFKMPDEGEYLVRVLPLAPSVNLDGTPVLDENGDLVYPMGQKGCEFRLRSMVVEYKGTPDKKGKARSQYLPFVQATQEGVGYSVDIMDEYVRIAKDMYADDEAVMNLLTGKESRERISWSRQRCLYVYDVTDGTPKGPMMWQPSDAQWKSISAERLSTWAKEEEKAKKKGLDPKDVHDPLCDFYEAWPLTITKTGKKLETKYSFKIDRGEDQMPLTSEQIDRLLELPRIPETIYHFSRYQLEAELAYLQQYDEKHDLEVCKDEEFLEAVEKLKGELPADDNSHFSFGGSGKSNGKESTAITLDSLNQAYDYIIDKNLGRDSDEYEALREDIRQFIEDNDLSDVVVVKHSKKIEDLLNELEEAMEERESAPAPKKEKKTPVAAPVAEDDEEGEEKEGEEASSEAPEPSADEVEEEEKPVARQRRRPARPVDDDEVGEDEAANDEKEVEEEKEEAPAPRRRRRQI